jgi:hypothetical protein
MNPLLATPDLSGKRRTKYYRREVRDLSYFSCTNSGNIEQIGSTITASAVHAYSILSPANFDVVTVHCIKRMQVVLLP